MTQDFEKITQNLESTLELTEGNYENKIGEAVARSMVVPRNVTRLPMMQSIRTRMYVYVLSVVWGSMCTPDIQASSDFETILVVSSSYHKTHNDLMNCNVNFKLCWFVKTYFFRIMH